jgi:hypothetical protein
MCLMYPFFGEKKIEIMLKNLDFTMNELKLSLFKYLKDGKFANF